MSLRRISRARLVAWVCVLAVLLVAASPVAAGLPLLVLPNRPQLFEPGSTRLPSDPNAERASDRLARGVVPARAPPLA